MTNILIADDHALIREGLKRTLIDERDIKVIGEAGTAEEVISLVTRRKNADILILDISMPGTTGLALLNTVRLLNKKLKVLVLSMHAEERFAAHALKEGASGYVSKGTAPDALLPAIRKVAAGGVYVSPTLAEQLVRANSKLNGVVDLRERLSEREMEVFLLIAAGKSVSTIADQLHLGKATIATYRARILEKAGFLSNADMTQYAYQHGLLT